MVLDNTNLGPRGYAQGAWTLTQPFTAAAATWNQRESGTAWTTAGGDFTAAHVGWIDPPTDPDQVAAGEVFAFPITGTLTLETNYAARKLYRFGSASATDVSRRPVLAVRYFVPGAADSTVNQRISVGIDAGLPLAGDRPIIRVICDRLSRQSALLRHQVVVEIRSIHHRRDRSGISRRSDSEVGPASGSRPPDTPADAPR